LWLAEDGMRAQVLFFLTVVHLYSFLVLLSILGQEDSDNEVFCYL
jgi:hypothetical protein